MAVRQRRYPVEEIARRGDEIYAQAIRSLLAPEHDGRVVAIDIETGEWEMDEDELVASKLLLARHPDAQIWLVRVGSPYLHRFGAGRARRAE
jgi:hypothetical protein